MAITKPYSWLNDDGLPVSFGLDEARLGVVAGYRTDGPDRCIEVVIDDASFFDATNEYLISDKVCLPVGAIVTKVEVQPNHETFASSSSGTISIGVVDDDFASNNDIDALLALASVAEMNAGGTAAGDGVLVQGAALTKRQFLTLSVDTAVYQTGAGSVLIYYQIPKKGEAQDTLVYTK